jgi:glycosyltransferase involved in cell wall biosynthesis
MLSKSKEYLFINWKDITHPNSGGAEVVIHQLLIKLINDGHRVTLLTSLHNGPTVGIVDEIKVIRIGKNKYLHSLQALFYYFKHLRNQYDYVIECVNTVPYFTQFITDYNKHYLFYHQLAREVWFYETKPPLAQLGYYLLEPIATKLQSIKNPKVITISASTKKDLVKWGFCSSNIRIISEGITNEPLNSYKPEHKNSKFTLLFHSSLRPMKRIIDVLEAFKIVQSSDSNIELIISGGGETGGICKYLIDNNLQSKVKILGPTTDQQKLSLMQQATTIISTSIKEGWGLIVTEANSMATPAITYNVDGLRDSNKTGLITKNNTPQDLADSIKEMIVLFYKDRESYDLMCIESLEFAKTINFEQCYLDFNNIVQ